MKTEDWIESVINGPGGFKTYESREFVVFSNREIGIAEFLIKALANPLCDGSGEVLQAIIDQRKKKVADIKKVRKPILKH